MEHGTKLVVFSFKQQLYMLELVDAEKGTGGV